MIEDDPGNQVVVDRVLRKWGLVVVLVNNGEEGVERACRETWSAVLMDLQMPGINGLDATRRIRLRLAGRALPIIALTAKVRPQACRVCGGGGG